MRSYIIRRLLIAIPLLLAMSFIVFVMIRLAPGDILAEYRLNPQISPETIRRLEHQYGLDKPVVIQYLYWLKNIVRGDLGESVKYKRPVSQIIKSKLANTVMLSVSSVLLTWLLAIPMGIYCAVHRNEITDKLFSFLAFIGMSIPNFFFALLLLYFAAETRILPIGGATSENYASMSLPHQILDRLVHLIIPTIVIATSAMAGLQRIMRGNMLEVLREQYITTARAKGLPENKVIYRHALRNAINPMVTIFGYEFSALLSGAALTEIVCNYPGIGSIMLDAVRSQDTFLVMGSMMISGVLLLLGNLIADILLAYVDPRIRYE